MRASEEFMLTEKLYCIYAIELACRIFMNQVLATLQLSEILCFFSIREKTMRVCVEEGITAIIGSRKCGSLYPSLITLTF